MGWPWSKSKRSKKVENVIEHITDLTFSSIVQMGQKCKSNVSASNLMHLDCSGPDPSKMYNECVNAQTKAFAGMPASLFPEGVGKALQQACGHHWTPRCNIRDVYQGAHGTLSMECNMDSEAVNKMKAELESQLQQKMDKVDDTIGDTLKDILQMGSSKDESSTTNQTRLHKMLEQSMSLSAVNEMISNVQATNELKLENNGTILSVAGLTQDVRAEAVGSMLLKSKIFQEGINKFLDGQNQDTKNHEKGLASVLESLAEVLKTWGLAFMAPLIACGVGILLLFIVLAFSGRGGGGGNAQAQAPNQFQYQQGV